MRIVAISFTVLFLELLFIRLIGSEIRIFAYLQNSVLIVCFLALGLGCASKKTKASFLDIFIPFIFLCIILREPNLKSLFNNISESLSAFTGYLIWYPGLDEAGSSIFQIVLSLILFLVLVHLLWKIFYTLGLSLGHAFNSYKSALKAYSHDILGSIIGVASMCFMSVFATPPEYWIVVGAFAIIALYYNSKSAIRDFSISLLFVVGILFLPSEPDAAKTIWSPYQKLAFHQLNDGNSLVLVNNVGYQGLFDVNNNETSGASHYDLPFFANNSKLSTLIVGAGTGNDVAAALKHDSKRVVAVEIDPEIAKLGKIHHPNLPYSSKKVELIVDDARGYFERSKEKFDVISFGLLDSHTLSNMTNVRLDHFVYTIESLTKAKSLLSKDGVFSVSFAILEPFQMHRLAGLFKQIFGDSYLTIYVPSSKNSWGSYMFMGSSLKSLEQIKFRLEHEENKNIHVIDNVLDTNQPLTSDDWPYFYLSKKEIPSIYLLLFGTLAIYFLLQLYLERIHIPYKKLGTPSSMYFLTLGAAFILFQTTMITKASLYLGMTWIVNGTVISSILIMIFLSNLSVPKLKNFAMPLGIVGVIISISALLMLPISSVLPSDYIPRMFVGSLLVSLPMFFSGLLFASAFQKSENRSEAFGSNLVGCFLGAILQILSFKYGLGSLLWLTLALYIFAYSLTSFSGMAFLRTKPVTA